MKKTKKWHENHKEVDGIIYKQCSKCKEWKIEDRNNFYYVNKSKPEKGFMGACIVCSRKDAKEYQEEHREDASTRYKEWYENNKEYKLQFDREWMNQNKDRRREYFQNYYDKNPEQHKKYNEKRAIKNHKITKNEWKACKEYFENACAYCGLPANEHLIKRKGQWIVYELHKEHVDDEGCGDLENCVPSCQSCNSKKHTYKLDEWYNENNPVYSVDRHNKIIKWITEDYKQYIEEKKPKRKYTKDPNNPKWHNSK